MLDEKTIQKIGRENLRDMLGLELTTHPLFDSAVCYSKEVTEEPYYMCAGATNKPLPEYKMGDETPYEYRAIVYIDTTTGEVTRDYENSCLPE
ncbi:MAG: hypothetical protein RR626_00360 [Anaerovoracaceae bacterium]